MGIKIPLATRRKGMTVSPVGRVSVNMAHQIFQPRIKPGGNV